MARICDYCGKKRDVGHNVSHAKNRTSRVRKPNLHTHRMPTDEGRVKMSLCTKCLRMVKTGKVSKEKALEAARG